MDVAQIRHLFTEQVRRGTAEDGTGSEVTATPHFVRWAAAGDVGWSEVSWSNLEESTVDEVIDEQLAYFSSREQSFVWRVFEDDGPSDLGSRLERAGFKFDGNSQLMVAPVDEVPATVAVPLGVTLSSESDARGIDRLIEVHESVFGIDHSQLRRSIRMQLARVPGSNELVVAMVDGQPIASSRVQFLPDRQFATLWGGSTLPEWRGKGLYRAMVAHRARSAARRGYSYLSVTASKESRPILERLSFTPLGSVSTYAWTPHAASN
jgi:GNAT superfamily N-acetyltransferase